jgi:hypothetical protein
MIKNQKRFGSIVKDIEFRMIRKDDRFFIKVVPINRVSQPSSLHLIINDEFHDFEIYDKDGKESHEIYFEGTKCNPCFYLKCGNKSYNIKFTNNGIQICQIAESNKLNMYVKKNCNCISSKASCWAKAVYYTSRPEKYPFNEM